MKIVLCPKYHGPLQMYGSVAKLGQIERSPDAIWYGAASRVRC